MHQCEHMKLFELEDLQGTFDRITSKELEKTSKNEIDIYSWGNKSGNGDVPLKFLKNEFLVSCMKCNVKVPIEKSLFKANLAMFQKRYPNMPPLGCTGLLNLGNTCYINAIIQVLSNLRCIKKYFLTYMAPKLHSGLLHEFIFLLFSLWQRKPSDAPQRFIREIYDQFPSNFIRGRHQDTLEFFHFFHNVLDKQIKQEYTDTFMTDVFTWKIKHSIKCLSCNDISDNYEELLELPLCIPRLHEVNELRSDSVKLLRQKDKEEIVWQTNSVWKKIKQ